MNEYRKAIDGLPLIVKILLALPLIDGVVYGVYRVCRGDTPAAILGIVWIFVGASVGWIVDMIFLLLGKPVWELSDADVAELKSAFKNRDDETSENENADNTDDGNN